LPAAEADGVLAAGLPLVVQAAASMAVAARTAGSAAAWTRRLRVVLRSADIMVSLRKEAPCPTAAI
jgi:hypothetical protein